MFMTLFYFFLALFILVVFHEYGHFQVARWCGVKVLRFSFGFGKILARWSDKKGTEYVWSLLPLGGYVKMLDETETTVADDQKHLAFNQQATWKKTLIVLAGPFFNFLFAFFALWLVAVIGMKSLAPIIDEVRSGSIAAQAGISGQQEIVAVNEQPIRSWREFQFAMMPHLGSDGNVNVTVKSLKNEQRQHMQLRLANWELDSQKPDLLGSLGMSPFIPAVPAVIADVVPDSPAETAGLQSGDRILAVDEQAIDDWLQLLAIAKNHPNDKLQMLITRDGRRQTLSVRLGEQQTKDGVTGFLGVRSGKISWPQGWLRTIRYSPLEAIPVAFNKTVDLTVVTFTLMGRLVAGQLGIENISGPVGIAKGAGDSAKGGLAYYLSFLALISISLGVLNLLPVPMLDGGHLLFYAIEALLGRSLSEGAKALSAYLGLTALVTLMLVALFNDISRLMS